MEKPSRFSDEALDHLDALYSTARRLTRNPAEAEDLVQDTYVKAFRFRDRFRAGTNLRAWLFTILHNTFLNETRRKKGTPVDPSDESTERAVEQMPSPGRTPEEQVLASAEAAEVDAALASLPDAYRQAVWLRDVQDLTYAEIAEVLGVPIGTVMSRIARGRRLLHDRVVDLRKAEIPGAPRGVKAEGT